MAREDKEISSFILPLSLGTNKTISYLVYLGQICNKGTLTPRYTPQNYPPYPVTHHCMWVMAGWFLSLRIVGCEFHLAAGGCTTS